MRCWLEYFRYFCPSLSRLQGSSVHWGLDVHCNDPAFGDKSRALISRAVRIWFSKDMVKLTSNEPCMKGAFIALSSDLINLQNWLCGCWCLPVSSWALHLSSPHLHSGFISKRVWPAPCVTKNDLADPPAVTSWVHHQAQGFTHTGQEHYQLSNVSRLQALA